MKVVIFFSHKYQPECGHYKFNNSDEFVRWFKSQHNEVDIFDIKIVEEC